MAPTPKKSVWTFVGLRSKRTYSIQAYNSDVANALVNWDAGAGAGASSPSEYRPPEDVKLIDVAIITGMADTTQERIIANNKPLDVILDYTVQVSTSTARPKLNLNFKAGTAIRAIQLA